MPMITDLSANRARARKGNGDAPQYAKATAEHAKSGELNARLKREKNYVPNNRRGALYSSADRRRASVRGGGTHNSLKAGKKTRRPDKKRARNHRLTPSRRSGKNS
jgi:hypothetical protein